MFPAATAKEMPQANALFRRLAEEFGWNVFEQPS
jgi:hypothetical protein